jgi:hypothetical protein
MRAIFLIGAVLAFGGATPCRATCLEDAAAFAERVCGAIQQGGSSTVLTASGQLSAEAKGWLSKLVGSAGADVDAEAVEKRFEGVVQDQLGPERSAARQCRSDMAKFAASEVCKKSSSTEQGFLSPGADPVPKASCRGARAMPKDTVEMLVGGSGLVTAAGKINIKIGSCEPFSIAKNANGLAVNANIFDQERKLVANITNNQFHAIVGDNLRVDQKGDLSTLAVYGADGSEWLFVRYMNPTTIRMRGQFFCPNEPPVYVTDDALRVGPVNSSAECIMNAGTNDFTWLLFKHR